MRAAVIAVGLAACVSSSSVSCPNGTVCPDGTACMTLTNPNPRAMDPMPQLCVTHQQQQVCAGIADGVQCGAPLDGTCYSGVCIQPAGCGNDWIDPGEVCDDGKQTSGDGCSADCKSDETCGNGVTDPVKLTASGQVPNEQCDDGGLVDHDGCDSRCSLEHARWVPTMLSPMPGLTNTSMAYDPTRGQLVLFGGLDPGGSNAVADTWLWDGHGWALASPLSSPLPREGHEMAYDVDRHRLVMFGATGTITSGETWEWDGYTWTQQFPQTAPSPRDGAALAYDARRKRIVLFGGSYFADTFSGTFHYNDTWEWDGTNWTQITTPTVPPGRGGAAMGYDPVRGRIVMYGGLTRVTRLMSAVIADTYEYDGTDWTLRATGTPTARTGARMAWDPVSRTVVMFGGNDKANDLDETWTWDGFVWTQRGTGPDARANFAMATSDHVIIVGGVSSPQTETAARTWMWSGTAWSEITPTPPTAQIANQVAFDDKRRQAVIVDNIGNTWLGNGASWLPAIASPQFIGRSLAGLAYDQARDRTILYSGADGTGPAVGDTWLWDGAAWQQAAPAASPPPRDSPLAYDAGRKRTVLFGGLDGTGTGVLDDTWEWDGTTWAPITPAMHPPARSQHALAYDPIGKRIVLFGGADASGALLGDTWTWDGTSWTQLSPALPPNPRSNGLLVWDPSGGRMLMFSGTTQVGNTNELWELTGTEWSRVEAPNPPVPRDRGAWFPLADGKGVALFSGQVPNPLGGGLFTLGDMWRLRWDGSLDETCTVSDLDLDGDGLSGCADPDCWATCAPLCPPVFAIPAGMKTCDDSLPRCGDGHCDPAETCRNCPGDCGACTAVCGDSFCDAPETSASCPGDCP